MAMITCKECDKQISDTASLCPHCGAKPEKSASWIAYLFGGLVLVGVIQSALKPKPEAPSLSPEAIAAKAKTEADFQNVVRVAKWAKAQSKNPDSFTLTYGGITSNGTVCIEYRGTNSFNAVVPGRYIMSDTVSGSTAALWNKHCANQPITDHTNAKHAL